VSLVVYASVVPLTEKTLIAQIRRMATGRRSSTVAAGIGDDCAVLRLPPGQDSLVTTDFSLEGIHFRRDWHPAESVGHRCLTRGLSDIAAMGGEPVAAFLSLALPRDLPQSWVTRFLRGFISLAEEHKVTLAGGDTAESPNGILADIVVVGRVPKGKAILRSGARPGDRIYVSGELGGSAAAVAQFENLRRPERPRLHERAEGSRVAPKRSAGDDKRAAAPPFSRSMRQGGKFASGSNPTPRTYPRHFYPEPRLELGRIFREKRLATAMIDTSDGLSTDLAHICEESKVGAHISSGLIPRARVGKPAREVPLDLALHGGEDYELLFTAPAKKRIPSQIAGVPLTYIGVITRSAGIFLRDAEGVLHHLFPGGWEHFRH
jgi:thiamine-monophosphate kinase